MQGGETYITLAYDKWMRNKKRQERKRGSTNDKPYRTFTTGPAWLKKFPTSISEQLYGILPTEKTKTQMESK